MDNTKIELAFAKFEEDYEELGSLMEWFDYSGSPYPDEENFLETYVTEDCDKESAAKFFDMVEEFLSDDGLMYDKLDGSNAQTLANEIRQTFNKITEKNGTFHSYCGFHHLSVCVAIGLACYYFVSEDTLMTCVFNRDKWESRGDYCSEDKVTYEISENRNGDYVYNKKFKPYSNM